MPSVQVNDEPDRGKQVVSLNCKHMFMINMPLDLHQEVRYWPFVFATELRD